MLLQLDARVPLFKSWLPLFKSWLPLQRLEAGQVRAVYLTLILSMGAS
jgi:hypothetical protein